MRIKINNEEIELNPKEVKAARKLVASFLKEVENSSFEHDSPTFFFTALIMMQLISQEAIDNIDAKNLKKVMNAFEDARKKSLPD